MPEVVAALTGRFARNPSLYYEMRLRRVTAHLQRHPDDLSAYDDAGVACDRLGRGDEAVAWMEQKGAQLETRDGTYPDVKEHRYRYHANLGTFLVHRWVRQGTDRAKIDEVKAARDEIAQALQINPRAHFGRERYQLRALEWIINPPTAAGVQYLPNLLGWNDGGVGGQVIDPQDADDAVRGLAGLVVLGSAWESVDVFHALDIALQSDSLGFATSREGGRNTLAYFAWLRCLELIDAGKGSMLPDAPQGESLKSMLPRPDFVSPDRLLDPAYQKLRAEAEAWQAGRTAFMIERLKQGCHPDTDASFWKEYMPPPAPALPTQSVPGAFNAWQARRQKLTLIVVFGVPMCVAALVVGWVRVRSTQVRVLKTWPARSHDGASEPG
jgi:hypothetical protein